ncbi:signal peptidase I [Coxiella endosymbiont of Amblyomma nuttalli]|uniref:signal peptidase I n=1 Tax=Coxiella endosymbiont of Amblyomma nuttalli TaxID=2749996 RepID=UPI001BAC0490|nr:signal peptidase I [Coxiella endosymbiont of Amblyomma nuttalli]QTS83945.1 Signal peptidase I [Coxiella endosymbiont of Amblyomma nuttalli]
MFDFLDILSLLIIFSGVICLVDIIWCHAKKIPRDKKTRSSPIIDYARSAFPILLIVLIIRSFLFQPYRIPTGSLEPTIMPGDLILVNQYDYGLHIPLWNRKIVNISEPKRGQIALFRWPVNPAVTFVKRVVGLPGDHISYQNKILYINGKEMHQKFIKDTLEIEDYGKTWIAKEYEEDLDGIKHLIILRPDRPAQDFKCFIVPKEQYLMIGDNRDDSDDSRSWGTVPLQNFIGRAMLIWMSWDSQNHRVRWERIGDCL